MWKPSFKKSHSFCPGIYYVLGINKLKKKALTLKMSTAQWQTEA